MQTAALLGGLASAVALVASLLFFAREAREAARQTRLANQIAETRAQRRFGTPPGFFTVLRRHRRS